MPTCGITISGKVKYTAEYLDLFDDIRVWMVELIVV